MERTHETYSVACELHQNHHYYDAISRAHYSMFYAAKAVLLTKDVITRTHRGKSHNSISILYEGELEERIWNYSGSTDRKIRFRHQGCQ